jgi:hypothetical protein
MSYKTVYTEVSVDVDISDFDTDDLIDELESRGEFVGDNSGNSALVTAIYEKRRLGQDYQTELDQLIYEVTGRIL